jgi:hypothetical protein
VAYRNLIDNASTTVTANTIGAQLDMQYRTTLGRAALGVPVRLRVWAVNTNAGEAQSVRLLNSAGSTLIEVSITDTGSARWYVQDGYIPATDAKYDLHFGGATVMPTVYSISLEEFCDDQPNEGALAESIGSFTATATGTFVAGENAGVLSQSIGSFTVSATGDNTNNAQVGQFVAPFTISATGTFVPGITWTTDATSGKGVPANNTEWGDLLTAASTSGTCRHLWLMQEASGNLADSISPAADFEYIGGTITYADTITGWTRKGPRFTSTASAFRNLDADLPTPNATSFLVFMLFKKNATPGANRSIWAIGLDATSGNYINLSLGSDDKLYLRDGSTAIGSGVSTYGTDVIPIIIRHDRTNSVQAIYTESEKIVATYNATDANEIMRIGDSSLNSPDMNILYSTLITGTAAEAGHATAKAILQQLGWSPGWSP